MQSNYSEELYQVYMQFEKIGLYLPHYHLRKISADPSFKKMRITTYVKYNPKLLKYTDKVYKRYNFLKRDKHLKKVRKKVEATEISSGKKTIYPSIFAAALALNKPLGFGNISNMIKTGYSVYGRVWRYVR